MRHERRSMMFQSAMLAGVTLTMVLGTAGGVAAQALKDLKTSDTPLVRRRGAARHPTRVAAIQRRGRVAELPFRF